MYSQDQHDDPMEDDFPSNPIPPAPSGREAMNNPPARTSERERERDRDRDRDREREGKRTRDSHRSGRH